MSDRPLKVLSVSTSDSEGGAARAAYRIHKAMRDLGVESRMFVKEKMTEDPTVSSIEDFIPHHALYRGYDWARNKVKNKWQHYLWGKYPDREKYFMSDLRATDIGNALRKIDYDVLHLHWINLRFLSLKQLPKDKPIIWTLHDSWPFCGVCHLPFECTGYKAECGHCPSLHSQKTKDLSHRVWRDKARIYDGLDLHIVAPSRWMADCARKSSLLGHFDIRTIPNCIDASLFCPGSKEDSCRRLGLDPEKRHFLFGAMFALEDPNKGFSYLRAAIQHLPENLRNSAELVLFGSDKPIEQEISSMRVINLGILKDSGLIVSAYRAADVTIVPSLSENLSCALMETLACGTPATAFNIGGNADLVDHQTNGYLAKEKDVEDLAAGIAWCLENNTDGRLSTNARDKVLTHYSPAVVAQAYLDIYTSV